MPGKPKTKTNPHSETQTWTVDLDGTPTEVTAENLDIDAGMLMFSTEDTIVRAVAVGHWTTVELKPPPPDAPPIETPDQ